MNPLSASTADVAPDISIDPSELFWVFLFPFAAILVAIVILFVVQRKRKKKAGELSSAMIALAIVGGICALLIAAALGGVATKAFEYHPHLPPVVITVTATPIPRPSGSEAASQQALSKWFGTLTVAEQDSLCHSFKREPDATWSLFAKSSGGALTRAQFDLFLTGNC
ncbi:MAG: hypothetical protein WCP28_09400 [Actinomycetes bacterium]